jgi:hypothetical protein
MWSLDLLGAWVQSPNLPFSGRNYASAVATPSGYVVVSGGRMELTALAASDTYIMNCLASPPIWSSQLAVPWANGLSHHVSVFFKGKAVIMGGANSAGTPQNLIYTALIDGLSQPIWSLAITPLWSARFSFVAAVMTISGQETLAVCAGMSSTTNVVTTNNVFVSTGDLTLWVTIPGAPLVGQAAFAVWNQQLIVATGWLTALTTTTSTVRIFDGNMKQLSCSSQTLQWALTSLCRAVFLLSQAKHGPLRARLVSI